MIEIKNGIVKNIKHQKPKKISKTLEQKLLKLSKKEIIELLEDTISRYFYNQIEFLPIALLNVLLSKEVEKEQQKIEKEQQDLDKANKEYNAFMREMFDKYGEPLNILSLNEQEMKKYLDLYENFKKHCLKGVKK